MVAVAIASLHRRKTTLRAESPSIFLDKEIEGDSSLRVKENVRRVAMGTFLLVNFVFPMQMR